MEEEAPGRSAPGQAEIEIEELDPLAGAAAVHVEGPDSFARISPLSEQQVPAAAGAAHAHGYLPEARHFHHTRSTLHHRLFQRCCAIPLDTRGLAPVSGLEVPDRFPQGDSGHILATNRVARVASPSGLPSAAGRLARCSDARDRGHHDLRQDLDECRQRRTRSRRRP